MSRIITACVLMLLAAALPFAAAQEKEKEKDPPKQVKDPAKDEKKDDKKDPAVAKVHDDIIALRKAFLAALEKKDADALIALTHPDVMITVQDNQELKTIRKHEGVKEYLTRHLTGSSPNIKSLTPAVEVDDWTILYGDDMGIASGKSKDHYKMADGREFDLPTRWTTTLVKMPDGSWKIANLHVANNLFDNPVLDAHKKSMTWFLIGAGVAGLVVGWILAKMMGGGAK